MDRGGEEIDTAVGLLGVTRIKLSPWMTHKPWLIEKPDGRCSHKCDHLTLKWHCLSYFPYLSFVLIGVGCYVFGCRKRSKTVDANKRAREMQHFFMFLCASVFQIDSSIGNWTCTTKRNSNFRNFHGFFSIVHWKRWEKTTESNYISL